MKCKVYVHEEIDSSYGEGRSHVDQRSLILSDHSEGRRLRQMMEWPLNDEQRRTYSGKVDGKVLEIYILDFGDQMFSGRVRLRSVEVVPASAADVKKAA